MGIEATVLPELVHYIYVFLNLVGYPFKICVSYAVLCVFRLHRVM